MERAVGLEEWRIEEGGELLATRRQVPLKLAWAMTIHKAQVRTRPFHSFPCMYANLVSDLLVP